MRDKRLVMLADWLQYVHGVTPEGLSPVSNDASFRRYFRFFHGDTSYIVMDAPPEQEDCKSFVHVSQEFLSLGVHVPQVLASDLKQGFLLLTDLGKQTYLQQLNESNADYLYHDAIATLIKIQQGGLHHLGEFPAYSAQMLLSEMQLFADWLLGQHLQISMNSRQVQQWNHCRQWLVEQALSQPVTWVHRDYHSRNLMVCDIPNPGVLDFQDTVEGPLTYDLVSLLKDCYIRWPRGRVLQWLSDYQQRASDADLPVPGYSQLLEWFDLMGVQRHLKAAGIFARLCHRDQKPGYLTDIPRVLAYIIDTAQRYPQLAVLDKLCQRALLMLT